MMDKQEIEKFYENHTVEELCKELNLSYYKVYKILKEYNIPVKKINGFKLSKEREFESIIEKYSKEYIEKLYSNSSNEMMMDELNISKSILNKILKYYNIPHHSAIEAKRIIYTKKYGSYEAGKKIEQEKIVANTDQVKRQEKVSATNKLKYGGNSPFSSEEIRNKAKNTFIERYGVENAFQIPEVVDIINQAQIDKYGGIGFASSELMQKYNETMLDRYGVKFACLTDNCKNSNHSKDSRPNLEFKALLDKNNILYEREYTIDNYNYDFKVGNTLIEINPTYTHNSTIPYRNTDKILSKDYHFNKFICALNNKFNHICIWDWDDKNKIIQSLKNPPEYQFIDNKIIIDNSKMFNLLNYNMEFVYPIKHYYNIRTKEHFIDNIYLNKDALLNNNFLEIYDCGKTIYSLAI